MTQRSAERKQSVTHGIASTPSRAGIRTRVTFPPPLHGFSPMPIRSLAARSPAYRLGYDLPIDGGMAFRGPYSTRICTPS